MCIIIIIIIHSFHSVSMYCCGDCNNMIMYSDPVYSVVGRENPYQRGEPVDLLQHSWYYGEMSVRQAEKKLSELEDSRFMIWVDKESELFLSLKLTDRMSHFKIERGPGWYTIEDTFQLFPSVPDLVGCYNLEQLPASSNVVNYYNLNGEFHSAVRGLQHFYDYITVKTTTMVSSGIDTTRST